MRPSRASSLPRNSSWACYSYSAYVSRSRSRGEVGAGAEAAPCTGNNQRLRVVAPMHEVVQLTQPDAHLGRERIELVRAVEGADHDAAMLFHPQVSELFLAIRVLAHPVPPWLFARMVLLVRLPAPASASVERFLG